jgi:hypothetical protein
MRVKGLHIIPNKDSQLWLALLVLLFPVTKQSMAQESVFKGQAIGWGVASQMKQAASPPNSSEPGKVWRGQIGSRYLPEVQFQMPVREDYSFDALASVNVWGSGLYWSADSIVWDGNIKPFRGWLRFSGEQFEIRGGLQKINFGSAGMLRPLMWFDQIDPRDPLQLTDGVWGILGRYYFLNNINIWVWGLYGNDKRKGWEKAPSVQYKPEFGFRAQVPVPGGEIATSYHYRVANIGTVYPVPHGDKTHVREKRLALDGKFDYTVGMWFEAALVHQEIHIPELKYRRALTLGADYTFGLGNGLNLMMEYFIYGSAERPLGSGEDIHFSAFSANYTFNIFTGLNAILFYDWSDNELYNFVNWSWQFDKWSFYIMGFWNPQVFNVFQGLEGANLYAGRGIQLMAVFNH